MKYFGIINKNVAAKFQLQWKIGNISDMFLQYSVLFGMSHFFSFRFFPYFFNFAININETKSLILLNIYPR